ncbi:zinc finger protein [Cinnamomum micranthum f. kanehirae]|uniref:Zinc finger protein n=1 Tax=Cinnamomum micranthum f. kanehirae TaxID=337451 RepID=A0A3S3QHV5_9MAGN|nr:zinc finger protein [Cinnamomum micranthum f. kanehirae]
MDPNHHPPETSEEEALKRRNTDCVYFLASPLTCKKGNDCEYRHSEGARMNPRDCWYWLNGNCLNPKCAFRHPPLEGLLATTGATAGSSVASQTAASTQTPAAHPTAAHNPSKQSVPCFYFQKGLCLKGDRCPFMHGPQPVLNPSPQQTSKVAASVTELQIIKKATGVLGKCTSQQKPVEMPPIVNPVINVEVASNNVIAAKKTMRPAAVYDDLPKTKPSNVPLIGGNGATGPHEYDHQALPPDEHLQNGREAGEFLGESSPGFDVLVDDEIQDSDYFQHEDEYGLGASNGGRHLNSINEFDYEHSSELDSLAKFDREPYNEYRDYDQYRRPHDQFGWEHNKTSSKRILEQSSITERRRQREESPDQIDRSDLRHRLSKQRKVKGSRSASSPDRHIEINHRGDRYGEEQRYRGHHRDPRHVLPETSRSNRLQGRIMLPGRSSPEKANNLRPDREMDRGRNSGRSSPSRPVLYQARHHDRVRQTQENNFTTEVRNFRAQPIKRDEIGILNFAGPKSLAELKGSKASDSREEQSTKNDAFAFKSQLVREPKTMKSGKAVGHLEPEGLISFEGPKPLREILKRKRETASGSGKVSSDGEDSGRSEIAATETPITRVFDSKKEAGVNAGAVTAEENDDSDEDGLVATEGYELTHEDPTSAEKGDALEMDGMTIDTMEDQELDETYDQRDGESDYETVEGGDFKAEDENAEPEDDYLDEDDDDDEEDDFSSKIGAMLS